MMALFKFFAFACSSALVLALCLPLSAAQFDCFTKQPKAFYNASVLSGTQITGNDVTGAWDFYLNLCSVAPSCGQDHAMACQVSANYPSNMFDVAFPNDDVGPHQWTEIAGGIELIAYGSGIFCQYEGNQRIALVNIYCDPNITGPVTQFSAPVVEGPACTYTMTIKHAAGCPLPLPPNNASCK